MDQLPGMLGQVRCGCRGNMCHHLRVPWPCPEVFSALHLCIETSLYLRMPLLSMHLPLLSMPLRTWKPHTEGMSDMGHTAAQVVRLHHTSGCTFMPFLQVPRPMLPAQGLGCLTCLHFQRSHELTSACMKGRGFTCARVLERVS